MKVTISHNLKKVRKSLDVDQKQVPFATSMAINNTLQAVAIGVTSRLPHYIDKPVPFTKRAFLTNSGRFRGKRQIQENLQGGQLYSLRPVRPLRHGQPHTRPALPDHGRRC